MFLFLFSKKTDLFFYMIFISLSLLLFYFISSSLIYSCLAKKKRGAFRWAPICMSHGIGFVGSWPCGELEKDKFAWCFFSFIMEFPFSFFHLINLLVLFLFCIFLSMTLKANEMSGLCKINVALGPKVVLFWAKMSSFFRCFGSSVRSTCTRS